MYASAATVPDTLLWTAGQRLAASHRPGPDNHCTQLGCAEPYPRLGRRIADQVIRASRRGWPHTWTARHDLRRYREMVSGSASRAALGTGARRHDARPTRWTTRKASEPLAI
jgi:hypothetical protein